MSTPAYRESIALLLREQELPRPLAAALMEATMAGELDHPQVAAVLTALSLRGESADELEEFARAMRAAAVPVDGGDGLVDTCGTGGSGLDTVNTSTLAAFVLAAAGVRVAKHGNRSASGRCGSADVLERLGVPIALDRAAVERLLAEQDLAFLFAPAFHPAMRHVVPVRRALGFRTVFNFLGPLCNPAGPVAQVLGVSDAARAPRMARALHGVGVSRALVVAGQDGLDELSLAAPTDLFELRPDGSVEQRVLRPEDVGLRTVPFASIAGGGPEENVRLFEALLRGTERGPRSAHLALNAGAGLLVAGVVPDLRAGVERAAALLESGAAGEAFDRYRAAARALAEEST